MSAVGMRWPISTMVSAANIASATAASRARGPGRAASAARAGSSAGKNSRMKAGPARGLANGPVSAPSTQRGWPNRLLPVRYCCQASRPIQQKAAASTIQRACRLAAPKLSPAPPGGGASASTQVPSAMTRTGRRMASRPSSSPPVPSAEQTDSHSHQASAASRKGWRSQATFRVAAVRSRNSTSMPAMRISASARACSSASGRSRLAARAARHAARSAAARLGLGMDPMIAAYRRRRKLVRRARCWRDAGRGVGCARRLVSGSRAIPAAWRLARGLQMACHETSSNTLRNRRAASTVGNLVRMRTCWYQRRPSAAEGRASYQPGNPSWEPAAPGCCWLPRPRCCPGAPWGRTTCGRRRRQQTASPRRRCRPARAAWRPAPARTRCSSRGPTCLATGGACSARRR